MFFLLFIISSYFHNGIIYSDHLLLCAFVLISVLAPIIFENQYATVQGMLFMIWIYTVCQSPKTDTTLRRPVFLEVVIKDIWSFFPPFIHITFPNQSKYKFELSKGDVIQIDYKPVSPIIPFTGIVIRTSCTFKSDSDVHEILKIIK